MRVGLAVGAIEGRNHFIGGERRHGILQLREFVGDVLGNQVGANREQLAELHEHGSQRFERLAQALAARCRTIAPEVENREERARHAAAPADEELVEPVAADGVEDVEEADESHENAILPPPCYAAVFFSRSKKCLRNLATLGSTTNEQ